MKTTHIRPKVEDAIKAFIAGNASLSIPVYLTAEMVSRDDPAVPPFVSVLCRAASPVVSEVGMEHIAASNRTIETTISIVTAAIDKYADDGKTVTLSGRDYHNAIAAQVMDLFFIAELITALNLIAADSITVQAADYVSDSTDPIENGYKTDLTININAIGGE